MTQLTVRTPNDGRTITVVGDIYRFLVTAADTDGKYAQFEAIVPPGGGPPPHVHSREEEGFFVLEGEITFISGERRFVAGPGSFVNMPIGTPHCFKNETDRPARMMLTVAPAGFEQMFLDVGTEVPFGTTTTPPPTKADIDKLLTAAPRYGIQILVPHP